MRTYLKIGDEPLVQVFFQGPVPLAGDELTLVSSEDRTVEVFEVVKVHRAYLKTVRESGEVDLESGHPMSGPSVVLNLKHIHERVLEPQEVRNLSSLTSFMRLR